MCNFLANFSLTWNSVEYIHENKVMAIALKDQSPLSYTVNS